MGDLTKNFDRDEFACRCGCGKGEMDLDFISCLQALRDKIDMPIHINSGLRCPKKNKKAGGHPKSLHLSGRAADCRVDDLSLLDFYRYALQIPEFLRGGIGIYPAYLDKDDKRRGGFIHLDNGKQARWAKLGQQKIDVKRAVEIIKKGGLT